MSHSGPSPLDNNEFQKIQDYVNHDVNRAIAELCRDQKEQLKLLNEMNTKFATYIERTDNLAEELREVKSNRHNWLVLGASTIIAAIVGYVSGSR